MSSGVYKSDIEQSKQEEQSLLSFPFPLICFFFSWIDASSIVRNSRHLIHDSSLTLTPSALGEEGRLPDHRDARRRDQRRYPTFPPSDPGKGAQEWEILHQLLSPGAPLCERKYGISS